MKKVCGIIAVSLVSLAVVGCGSGRDTASEANTQPSDGTSEMMGGDNADPNPNLGTAEGQDIDDVDVKMNPNMQHDEEEMTGAEEIKDQRPEPQ
jgi:ABC-type glycerol-3-phosphate transport system substrate-binding protein